MASRWARLGSALGGGFGQGVSSAGTTAVGNALELQQLKQISENPELMKLYMMKSNPMAAMMAASPMMQGIMGYGGQDAQGVAAGGDPAMPELADFPKIMFDPEDGAEIAIPSIDIFKQALGMGALFNKPIKTK